MRRNYTIAGPGNGDTISPRRTRCRDGPSTRMHSGARIVPLAGASCPGVCTAATPRLCFRAKDRRCERKANKDGYGSEKFQGSLPPVTSRSLGAATLYFLRVLVALPLCETCYSAPKHLFVAASGGSARLGRLLTRGLAWVQGGASCATDR